MSVRQGLLNKLRSLPQIASVCEGRVFWLDVKKNEDLPCVFYKLAAGKAGEITACGPATQRQATVEIYAMSRDAGEPIVVMENIQSDAPAGLHGASWTEDGTRVTLAAISEFIMDDYWDAPFYAFVCGCVLEINYEQLPSA